MVMPCLLLDLSSALAAHTLTLLALGLDGVHDLHERGHHLGDFTALLNQSIGSTDSGSKVGLVRAVTAAWLSAGLLSLGITCRALTHELTLRLGAGDWLLALPVTLGCLTHWGTDGVGCLTLSAAVGWGADSLTLGAILLLTQILRATNVTLRLVTVNLALGTLSLLTVDLALWSLAHRVADGRAYRIIALPSAFRVAVSLDFGLSNGGHEVSLSRGGDGEGTQGQQSQESEKESAAHGDDSKKRRGMSRTESEFCLSDAAVLVE